jgi:hypothetical protein
MNKLRHTHHFDMKPPDLRHINAAELGKLVGFNEELAVAIE